MHTPSRDWSTERERELCHQTTALPPSHHGWIWLPDMIFTIVVCNSQFIKSTVFKPVIVQSLEKILDLSCFIKNRKIRCEQLLFVNSFLEKGSHELETLCRCPNFELFPAFLCFLVTCAFSTNQRDVLVPQFLPFNNHTPIPYIRTRTRTHTHTHTHTQGKDHLAWGTNLVFNNFSLDHCIIS